MKKIKAQQVSRNALIVNCPNCGRHQRLSLGEKDYTISTEGVVFPKFVCMAQDKTGHYGCYFEGDLQIVNIKSLNIKFFN